MNVPISGPAGPRPPAPAFDPSVLDYARLMGDRARAIARADAANPPITRVVPVPRAIPLGGSLRVVAELRLSDLALIQAWLEEQAPHPLEGLAPAWADPEPATRPARLAAAWQAAANWPVRLGTDRAAALLATAEGRAYFLAVVLRRHDPDFAAAQALALLPEITPAEWAGLIRVAYALTPRQEIAAEVAPEAGGRTANWCLSAYRASQAEGGPSPAELPGWTVGQWRNFCGEGKDPERSAEFAETARRVRKALGVGRGR